jgi:hypothetical protein
MIIDRRNARSSSGDATAFYPALEFLKAFEVWKWNGWTSPQEGELRPRKFTHELISHGTVILNEERFVQASLEELIKLGLYELFPYFQVPANGYRRSGLYTSEVACRKVGYPPNEKARASGEIYSYDDCAEKWPLTVKTLELVRKLTRLFTRPHKGEDDISREPHLHVFLGFLTFHKRLWRDPIFIKWIRDHYTGIHSVVWLSEQILTSITAQDVIDLYDDGNGGVRPGFTHVASNLPGYMQYLHIVRAAQWAFGLPELPPNTVETHVEMMPEDYKDTDDKEQRKAESCYKCDTLGNRLSP